MNNKMDNELEQKKEYSAPKMEIVQLKQDASLLLQYSNMGAN